MELVNIKASDYGLEETKAKQISEAFKPMLDKMSELESEFNEVSKLEVSEDNCKKAKELRLKYVKVRTGTATIHKEMKSFYLAGGKFVDGWKNAQLFACQGIEEKLKSIENHYENIEQERRNKSQEERIIELKNFDVEFIPNDLCTMSQEVWDNYMVGVKAGYNAKIEAEQKVEKERVAKEKEEAAEKLRIQNENDKLKAEASESKRLEILKAEKRSKRSEELRPFIIFIRDYNTLIESDDVVYEKELKDIKIGAEQHAKAEQLKADKALKEQQQKDKIALAEKTKREALEKELKAKEAAELKTKEEEEARIQSQLSKGDSEKVKDLIQDLTSLKNKYSFKSAKNKKMYNDVSLLIDKVINHISK